MYENFTVTTISVEPMDGISTNLHGCTILDKLKS